MMRNIIQEIYYIYCDIGLLEMTNLRTRQTGLDTVIHVSSKGGAKHGARVKVSNVSGTFAHDNNFTVTTEGNVIGSCKLHSSHLQDVQDWVKINREHIHNVWHNGADMDPEDVLNGFKKL